MKKYILRLCLCVVLLAGIVLLAMLIRSKVDGIVKSKLPEQETKVSATTAPTEKGTKPTEEGDSSGFTAPSEIVDPSESSQPTEEGETTAPTTETTTTTAPTTGTTGPTTSTTAPTTATTATTATTTPTTAPTTPKPNGQTAPDVTFYDSQGNPVSVSAFKDKPMVLCFWASWATGSKDTLDLLQAAYNKYGDRVSFVVVNLTTTPRETREAADAYWASTSYSFPTYYDLDGACRAAYKADTVPTTFFMKEEHFALAYCKGKLTKFGLSVGLELILPEE